MPSALGPRSLEALFPRHHAPLTPVLLAYAPFGCVLAAARILLWLALFALDSPSLVDADGPLEVIITRCLGVRDAALRCVACALTDALHALACLRSLR